MDYLELGSDSAALGARVRDIAATADGPIVVPVARRLSADLLTPVAAFLALRRKETPCFLFESVEGGEKIARYSFIGRDPYLTLRGRGNGVDIHNDGKISTYPHGNIFSALTDYAGRYTEVREPTLPRLTGGAVGYFGYDVVRLLEHLPNAPDDDLQLPDASWSFYDTIVAFDHVKHQIIVIANLFLDAEADPDLALDAAVTRIDETVNDLGTPPEPGEPIAMTDGGMASNFDRADFTDAVRRAKELIREGDIFQVVLSQRFSKEFSGDDFNLYRALRQVNPSPYLFYMNCVDFSIVGSSPELLVRVEDGRVETLPIAGTRRRGRTLEEDQRLAQELLSDPKERAEHVMLVDLGRNDLSRVCREGTVRVDSFARVERFSHVMHIVSSVSGDLSEGRAAVDVLKACFPAGTVSGAPKVRAMEIIDELEPCRRGIYAGCVGYLDFSGNLDTCIAIRTMIVKDNSVYVQAGAGIVADSDPEMEYEETRNKARALDRAIQLAGRNLLQGGHILKFDE